jgi:hypothetical protein
MSSGLRGKMESIMSNTDKRKKPLPVAKRPREQVLADVFEVLAAGESLDEACRRVVDAPVASAVMRWVMSDPDGAGAEYARAREIGYRLLGDRIDRIAGETHSMIMIHEQDPDGNHLYNADGTPKLKQVLAPLSADVIASKRLQVDALKWKLSKMLPKVYGDKVTQEVTGAGGGPLQVATMDFKGLTDDELKALQALMTKANAQ